MGYKEFGSELLLAADVNEYLMRQAVMRVANAAERDAIPNPEAGMIVHRADADRHETWSGTAWQVMYEGDTGWQSLVPAVGFESKSGTLRYRRRRGVVHLGGLIGPVSGVIAPGTNAILGNLPPGFRPLQAEWFACGTNTNQPTATIVVLNSGGLQLRSPNAGVSYVGLGSIRFLVD